MAIQRRMRLGDILVNQNVLSSEVLDEVLQKQKGSGKKIGEVLVDGGYITEEEIAQALHMQLGLELVTLTGMTIPASMRDLVKYDLLKKYVVVPFEVDPYNPNILHLAMADPMDLAAIDDISIVTNMQVEPYVATPKEILSVIDRWYGMSETMSQAMRFKQERDALRQAEEEEELSDVSDAPIVKLVRSLIEQAILQQASDIHIEALGENVRIRYRIDGVLTEKMVYDISLLSAISTRIKIMGGMDISEKRKPQDGHMSLIVNRREYDLRISSIPTVHGEKLVLRISDKMNVKRDKADLGLSGSDLARFNHMFSKPYGIIFVTGPTGSGKSTTLYTALSDLNKDTVNIVTIEDPVEADLEGLNQIQVNSRAGLTFASALRAILRQDPDIIMIGEIRDEETANIAVQASITGHLVVSTLHTNNAVGTLNRMADMGVEPYLIADSVIGVIAQRLVRKLCPHCKKKHIATEEEKAWLKVSDEEEIQLYEPCGCGMCNNIGYSGRTAIFEIMEVNGTMRRLIARNASTEEMIECARESGMRTLRENGIELIKQGITTIEEVIKASYEHD